MFITLQNKPCYRSSKLVNKFKIIHKIETLFDNLKIMKTRQGVVNDPLGQPTQRPAVKICFILFDLKSGDGQHTWI